MPEAGKTLDRSRWMGEYCPRIHEMYLIIRHYHAAQVSLERIDQ